MLSKQDKETLIDLLQKDKEIPSKYGELLLGKEEIPKEYELVYAGKTREEDIIAETLAAPLQEVRTFNSDNKPDDCWTNKLIFGDNLMALKSLYEDPNLKGNVKLIYIDPPFATKKDFMKDDEKAYKDKITGSSFLEFTRKRLVLLKQLLSNDGSIYVHLDQKKGHYIKILLDELFEENKFVNEIIWGYKTGGIPIEGAFARKHDSILLYKKSENNLYHKLKQKSYTKTVPEPHTPSGKALGVLRDDKCEYCDNSPGPKYRYVDMRDVWDDINSVYRNDIQSTGYPTQKPEALLERIIRASSNEGDIVIDVFAGSGTTLAVAEKLNRRWIGIDCGKLAIYTMQKRLLNLREEVGNKGKSLKAKSFTLYNAGLYDWEEVKKLDFNHYRDFVLKLFQVRDERHTVQGLDVDGYIGNENAYLWNHTKEKKAKLDLDFVESLHKALSGKGGDIFYIMAPTNAFAFYEDEVRFDDTTYKTLRVPQSVITELIKHGGDAIKQPTSEQDVNDTIDAVGFDFIQVPHVETEYKIGKPKEKTLLNQETKECVIKIKTFKSRTLSKSPEEFENYETLSMVMVDYNYDGKVFDLDDVFYADEIKPEYEVRFDKKKLEKQMMAIYLDIYGNEKKDILNLNDFNK